MKNKNIRTGLLSVISTLLLATQNLGAQIEEITVTAQKRAESAQDIGLTITAFDEDTLREVTGGSLAELAAMVSNVASYSSNTYLQSVHVRGIGLNEFQGQYDSPVAQHYDEVYIAKPWMKFRKSYDIERVEVLKGPQGTVFGRNTTGGAVNYYTARPTDKFGYNIDFEKGCRRSALFQRGWISMTEAGDSCLSSV